MRRKVVTIRDVAARAQVSVSTVSQILNGNNQYVGQDKRERVLKAAKDLHYRPNAIARSMVKRRTASIGLVVTSVINPLFINVVESIEEVLNSEGYHMVLASAPDVESEIQAIETLRAQQVDGFIFMSLSICSPLGHILRLKDEGVPFVIINRCFEGEYAINQVQFNDREAGYLATKHLMNLGHTRIATLAGPLDRVPCWRSSTERHQGWRRALEEQGMEILPEWIVQCEYTYGGGYKGIQELVAHFREGRERPTALFVANDEMAIGALRALHYAGVRVPQDMAVITVGDPPFAAYTAPALTTLAHPVPEAGRIATRLVLDQLKSGNPAQMQNILLSFSLQVRESCGGNPEPGALL